MTHAGSQTWHISSQPVRQVQDHVWGMAVDWPCTLTLFRILSYIIWTWGSTGLETWWQGNVAKLTVTTVPLPTFQTHGKSVSLSYNVHTNFHKLFFFVWKKVYVKCEKIQCKEFSTPCSSPSVASRIQRFSKFRFRGCIPTSYIQYVLIDLFFVILVIPVLTCVKWSTSTPSCGNKFHKLNCMILQINK